MQPSWFVQSLVFQLCVEVNKVGSHALPQPTLQELLQACLDRTLQHYHSLSQQARSKVSIFLADFSEFFRFHVFSTVLSGIGRDLICEFLCLFHCHSVPQDGVCHMTQNRALQLLFDLRYLNTTLGSRQEEGKSSRSQQDYRYLSHTGSLVYFSHSIN